MHASQAITELHEAGFTQQQIGVVMKHSEDSIEIPDRATEHDSQSAAGALTGALAGLGLGALTGLGVLAGVIPVVGPAIAAGTLGVILSNAAAGAGVVGLVGAWWELACRNMKLSTTRVNSKLGDPSSQSMQKTARMRPRLSCVAAVVMT